MYGGSKNIKHKYFNIPNLSIFYQTIPHNKTCVNPAKPSLKLWTYV